ncbi:topoisomerase DNA-binding C4 zinc finger domain-containing protein [Salirhabdus salicampi]|uniref:topoisomerase DNA-binding C4 zinc finger domain-containing protein n=1 Tax=Salirhabdus salicampi TaxID=476102 RepID=UPI0020C563C1|nr:topoisomerase DNA-binding C4 zinc finger domain-containing protein [Salirhabdus salicampi]MCP8615247.1 topoisomerase DNA-binding C4 zinc finger domain-containing protein [Salirhabdus salicampi]
MKAINKEIESLIITDKKELRQVRKQHIKSVKEKTSNRVNKKKSSPKNIKTPTTKTKTNRRRTKVIPLKKEQHVETCPKCGGGIVERRGKYGKFFGCNNYPKCKYTVKSG